MKLIEEIDSFLNEKIRTKKGLSTRDPRYDNSPAFQDDRFKWNTFVNIPSPYEKMKYARRFLKQLGSGSSRDVYQYSTDKVLKITNEPSRGIAQNEAEVAAYTHPATKDLVAKIFDFDDKNFYWLVSEAVRPLTRSDIRKHFDMGVSPSMFFGNYFYYFMRLVPDPSNKKEAEHAAENLNSEIIVDKLTPEAIDFFVKSLKFADHVGISRGDIPAEEHWGVTAKGRVVMLDYGLTSEILNQFYT